jgi:hypothetical protein
MLSIVMSDVYECAMLNTSAKDMHLPFMDCKVLQTIKEGEKTLIVLFFFLDWIGVQFRTFAPWRHFNQCG